VGFRAGEGKLKGLSIRGPCGLGVKLLDKSFSIHIHIQVVCWTREHNLKLTSLSRRCAIVSMLPLLRKCLLIGLMLILTILNYGLLYLK
jgi:hypothetical protein